jgi:hypothetical protein
VGRAGKEILGVLIVASKRTNSKIFQKKMKSAKHK